MGTTRDVRVRWLQVLELMKHLGAIERGILAPGSVCEPSESSPAQVHEMWLDGSESGVHPISSGS